MTVEERADRSVLIQQGDAVLSKEWLLLSSDMELVCLRIAAGLTKPVTEQDVQALLLASNCRRYQPLNEGIKQAISLLNTLLTNPAAPVPANPIPVGKRQDARLAVIVEKDRMSAIAQITADWGGKYVTLEQLKEAIAISEIKQGVSEQLLTAAIQSAKEAAPGSQLKLVIANGQPAVNGQDTRYERLVETPAERILKPQELGHGKVDLRDLGSIVTVKAGAQLMRRHPATQGVDGDVFGEVGANLHRLRPQTQVGLPALGIQHEVAVEFPDTSHHLPAVPAQVMKLAGQLPAAIALPSLECQPLQFARRLHLPQGVGADATLPRQQGQHGCDAPQADRIDASAQMPLLGVELNVPRSPLGLVTPHLQLMAGQLPAIPQPLPLQQTAA